MDQQNLNVVDFFLRALKHNDDSKTLDKCNGMLFRYFVVTIFSVLVHRPFQSGFWKHSISKAVTG